MSLLACTDKPEQKISVNIFAKAAGSENVLTYLGSTLTYLGSALTYFVRDFRYLCERFYILCERFYLIDESSSLFCDSFEPLSESFDLPGKGCDLFIESFDLFYLITAQASLFFTLTCSLGDDRNSLVFLAAMAGDMTLEVICLYLSSCCFWMWCTNSAEYV